MDFEKYQDLHAIIMLKDVIRKWWRAELCFADKTGVIAQSEGGEMSAPANAVSPDSRRNQSIRVLHEKFRSSKKVRRAVFQDREMNFAIVGAAIYIGGAYEGFLFVEGLAKRPVGAGEAELLGERSGEVNGTATDPGGAIESAPIIRAEELEKLTDLLQFAAEEIESFEDDNSKRGEAPLDKFQNIVGRSAPMRDVFRLVDKVANSDSTVLVDGESGTGKELVARAIHYNGARKEKPFVVQNCSAFNDNLLESALFGHLKGSFTGALRDKKGLFEVADGGTFFLDEIGDMSPALQVKLLRVLQEGTFLPVGGTQVKKVDVRVIAATHKNLTDLLAKGLLREDLFYRINVIRIRVPALRERRDDIPVLIDYFMRKHHRKEQRSRALAPSAVALLCAYSWPGNIRELENEIERLLVLGSDLEVISADLVSSRIREAVTPRIGDLVSNASTTGRLNDAVELLEREMIQQGLLRTQNNKSQLARELGISRSNLILKIAKYRLQDEDFAQAKEASA